jgi:hypothetical protein
MRVADFESIYAGGEASIAVGDGPGVIAMRNQHGVVLQLESVPQGVKLSVAICLGSSDLLPPILPIYRCGLAVGGAAPEPAARAGSPGV